jgi:type I restriction enzyme S subunit
MKTKWEKVKIIDVGDIVNDSVNEFSGTRRYLTTGSLEIDQITNTVEVTYADKPSRANLNIKTNDVILARMKGTNKVLVVGNEESNLIVSTGFLVLRPNKELDSRYLSYYLLSSTFQKRKDKLCTGATQKAINNTRFGQLEIPLPPLEVQKKITEVLDRADAIKSKRLEAIDKLDELVQGVFLDMFGDPKKNQKEWKPKKLGSICNVRSSRRIFRKELVESGVPFYRGQEIKDLSHGKKIDTNLFITTDRYNQILSEDDVPKVGDFLLPSITPDGDIWIVNTKEPFYFKDGRVLWIENNNSEIESPYLKYFLKLLFNAKYEKIASGSTFKELKIFALEDIDILIPPKTLQVKFKKILEDLTINKNKSERISKMENNLLNSLMQRAFKGELEFSN